MASWIYLNGRHFLLHYARLMPVHALVAQSDTGV